MKTIFINTDPAGGVYIADVTEKKTRTGRDVYEVKNIRPVPAGAILQASLTKARRGYIEK